jgi:hypothetical protein
MENQSEKNKKTWQKPEIKPFNLQGGINAWTYESKTENVSIFDAS